MVILCRKYTIVYWRNYLCVNIISPITIAFSKMVLPSRSIVKCVIDLPFSYDGPVCEYRCIGLVQRTRMNHQEGLIPLKSGSHKIPARAVCGEIRLAVTFVYGERFLTILGV